MEYRNMMNSNNLNSAPTLIYKLSVNIESKLNFKNILQISFNKQIF